MSAVRVLIVEDEPLVAEDIAGCLESIQFEVAGIAYSAERGLELLDSERPDAALLDITLAGAMDGIQLGQHIRDRFNIPFIFLTSHSDRQTLERAKQTRPSGYLIKPFDETDLMTSLEVALFNHVDQRSGSAPLTVDRLNRSLPNPLSAREFEIVQFLRQGKTNQQIADGVFLSVNTIKTHLQRIYDKLDAKSRTEALYRIERLAQE